MMSLNFSKTKFSTLLLSLGLLSTVAFAGTADSKMFVKNAARDGMAEVALANLALQMASNPDIQSFAKHMIEDHTMANDRLAELATAGKVSLYKDVTPKQKSTKNRLAKLNDRNRSFDRAYLKEAIADHQKAIKAYEKQSKYGTDADIKAFAAETLPKLKMHLDMAAALQTKIGEKKQEN